jgi:DNA-binding Xre family transcriptional regulator
MEIVAEVTARFRLLEVLEGQDPPMSQRELAQRSEVSPTTVNRMCKNLTAQVSLRTLDALAKVLRVEPGELIERVPEGKRRGRG